MRWRTVEFARSQRGCSRSRALSLATRGRLARTRCRAKDREYGQEKFLRHDAKFWRIALPPSDVDTPGPQANSIGHNPESAPQKSH